MIPRERYYTFSFCSHISLQVQVPLWKEKERMDGTSETVMMQAITNDKTGKNKVSFKVSSLPHALPSLS